MEAASKCDSVEHVIILPDEQSDADIADGTTVNIESLLKYEHALPLTESLKEVHEQVNPWLLPYSSGTTGLPKGKFI